jgi:hypothetical protein
LLEPDLVTVGRKQIVCRKNVDTARFWVDIYTYIYINYSKKIIQLKVKSV